MNQPCKLVLVRAYSLESVRVRKGAKRICESEADAVNCNLFTGAA